MLNEISHAQKPIITCPCLSIEPRPKIMIMMIIMMYMGSVWGNQWDRHGGKERKLRGEENGVCCIYTNKDSIMNPRIHCQRMGKGQGKQQTR
jgi:hypothetical protein